MSRLHNIRIVLKHSQPRVAVAAEQATDAARLVVMVDNKTLLVNDQRIAPTDGAKATLIVLHLLELFRRQAELLQSLFILVARYAETLPAKELLHGFFRATPATASRLRTRINLVLRRATATGETQTVGMAGRGIEEERRENATAWATADLRLSQILRRGWDAITETTSNRLLQPTTGVLFVYNGIGQGVNLRNRFASWLGSFGVSAPFEPLAF